jgi:hypothetical protein
MEFKYTVCVLMEQVGLESAIMGRYEYTYYCAGDKIEINQMGRACSSDLRGKRCIQDFGGET